MVGQWNDAIRKLPGPAPKEKEMEAEFQTCPRCKKEEQWSGAVEKGVRAVMDEVCDDCRHDIEDKTAELRAVWDRTYFAALTGLCMNTKISNEDAAVHAAEITANTTITRWPAMTAERDALIRKAVKG